MDKITTHVGGKNGTAGIRRTVLAMVTRSGRAARRIREWEGREPVELNGRELSWDGCVNARDLGGLGQVRPGAVVRMEQPGRLTEAGWAAAWAHGVRAIVDLRDAGEREPDRAPRPADITTVQVPLDPVGTPMLAEHPERVIAAVRAIASAAPGMRGVPLRRRQGQDRPAGPGASSPP